MATPRRMLAARMGDGAARTARLAEALRANLKRRKGQTEAADPPRAQSEAAADRDGDAAARQT